MDLEVLKEIERHKKKLNYNNIKNSSINFYVTVFDNKHKKIKYLDGKKDTLEAINLSAFLAPYIYLNTKSKDLYDGGMVPSDHFLQIAKNNKDKTIIWIMNEKRNIKSQIKDLPFQVIDLYAKSMYFGFWYLVHHLIHFFDEPSIETVEKNSNVILIHPDVNVRKVTKNRKEIVALYYHGLKKGKEILKVLDIK